MKKLAVLGAMIVFAALSTGPAQAGDQYGFYLTPKIFLANQKVDATARVLGMSASDNFRDNVGGGALAIGYDFACDFAPVRLELEFALRGKATSTSNTTVYSQTAEVRTSSIFANVYYDFHNSSDFTPYIGAGLGAARLKGEYRVSRGGMTLLKASESDWNFAWNIGAGVSYRLTDSASLDLGYRYADFGDLSARTAVQGIPVSVDADVTGHEVLLGVRFTF